MKELVTYLALAAIILILGIIHMSGNLAFLHSYHKKRIKKEDEKAFGMLIGFGETVLALSFGVFGVIRYSFDSAIMETASYTVITLGAVISISVIFYALKKYNKGIF